MSIYEEAVKAGEKIVQRFPGQKLFTIRGKSKRLYVLNDGTLYSYAGGTCSDNYGSRCGKWSLWEGFHMLVLSKRDSAKLPNFDQKFKWDDPRAKFRNEVTGGSLPSHSKSKFRADYTFTAYRYTASEYQAQYPELKAVNNGCHADALDKLMEDFAEDCVDLADRIDAKINPRPKVVPPPKPKPSEAQLVTAFRSS